MKALPVPLFAMCCSSLLQMSSSLNFGANINYAVRHKCSGLSVKGRDCENTHKKMNQWCKRPEKQLKLNVFCSSPQEVAIWGVVTLFDQLYSFFIIKLSTQLQSDFAVRSHFIIPSVLAIALSFLFLNKINQLLHMWIPAQCLVI